MRKPDLLVVHRHSKEDMRELGQHYILHVLSDSPGPDAFIAGAALDVFWNKPSIDPGSAELDSVVLQPHRSSATVETRTTMAGLVRDNLQAFFNCEPLLTEYEYTRLAAQPFPYKTNLRHARL